MNEVRLVDAGYEDKRVIRLACPASCAFRWLRMAPPL